MAPDIALTSGIGEFATSSRDGSAAAGATGHELLEESRAAVALLLDSIAALEQLGGGPAELGPLCDRLRRQLGREEAVIGLSGPHRGAALETILGAQVVAAEPRVTIRLRAAAGLTYRATWDDGSSEEPHADQGQERTARVARLERQIADENDKARFLAESLQNAARSATHARTQLAELQHDLTALRPADVKPPERRGEPAPALEPAPAVPRRSWLVSWFGWILSLWRRLFARPAPPALAPPEPEPPVIEIIAEPTESEPHPLPHDEETLTAGSPRGMAMLDRRVAEEAERLAPAAHAEAQIEAELRRSKARLIALVADHEQARRDLENHQAERQRRVAARLLELSAGVRPAPLEVAIGAPGILAGISLLVLPVGANDSGEPSDAMLMVDAPMTREQLIEHFERIRAERPLMLARHAVAAVCLCKNRIAEIDQRAQRAHDERLEELAARRVHVGPKEQLAAQLPVARHADQIVQDAATRLERLVKDARTAWEQRIDSCGGLEQLRAEVAAIENGAAHRLSLVCDELRETMTVQCVRLVLELSRPLRQELLRKRMEVARGCSAQLDESFENIRVVLPGSLEQTFGSLCAPGVGDLMSTPRSMFDPIFRTLARDKRECIARLDARLDESERTTVRELFAAAVYLSPLLLSALGHMHDSMVAAHERWLEARLAEAETAHADHQARHAPALQRAALLEQQEARLTRLLEP